MAPAAQRRQKRRKMVRRCSAPASLGDSRQGGLSSPATSRRFWAPGPSPRGKRFQALFGLLSHLHRASRGTGRDGLLPGKMARLAPRGTAMAAAALRTTSCCCSSVWEACATELGLQAVPRHHRQQEGRPPLSRHLRGKPCLQRRICMPRRRRLLRRPQALRRYLQGLLRRRRHRLRSWGPRHSQAHRLRHSAHLPGQQAARRRSRRRAA